jgi:hypothetical protein
LLDGRLRRVAKQIARKVAALAVDPSATEGERDAARHALDRLELRHEGVAHAALVAEAMERSDNTKVQSWVKNDHLGFYISYLWNGSRRRYLPDFLVRLKSGEMLVLEIKGQPTDESRAKQKALTAWVNAVNAHGSFGSWRSAEITDVNDLEALMAVL